MRDRSWHATHDLSGLHHIYTDFDAWLCRFKEYCKLRSSNLSDEIEVYIEQTGLRIKTKNKKHASLTDENGDFLMLPDVIINSISVNKRVTFTTDNKKNKIETFTLLDEGPENFDYLLFNIVNNRNKDSYKYIKYRSWHATHDLSGLHHIYTDFDAWLCRFKEYCQLGSSNLSDEIEVCIEQTGLRIKTKNKKHASLTDENGDFLMLPDVIINSISVNKRVTFTTDNKNNKIETFTILDEGPSNFDYLLFNIVNNRNKDCYKYIKCKL